MLFVFKRCERNAGDNVPRLGSEVLKREKAATVCNIVMHYSRVKPGLPYPTSVAREAETLSKPTSAVVRVEHGTLTLLFLAIATLLD